MKLEIERGRNRETGNHRKTKLRYNREKAIKKRGGERSKETTAERRS